MAKKMTLLQLKCYGCGHKWFPRTDQKPVQCPKCKSTTWDKKKKDNSNK